MIRGHRYKVLEKEFFRFVLAPLEAALQNAYAVGAKDIAKGIQSIADSFRGGYGDAIEKMHSGWSTAQALVDGGGMSMAAAMGK
ncbi:hypothetical protein XI07_15715 [Bradyrhizobium sp. CCBAU 11445]|uniref:hypothetical protein n=1 Tax=unclassified Bradyrhizobium TaxID=2631580 RepID=UPI0023056985|nr:MULTISPECIES: hypothetical protein [unclassified Bradyrhizobium]MDA9483434.1 hypothetical protein [Bradyrhizobium sp. CCBAU 11445]MDA9523332.1 hypothetical protein [Bradyrhizobium sp. CCBAU 11434]